jgi:spermidine/putrescine transport system permease protein
MNQVVRVQIPRRMKINNRINQILKWTFFGLVLFLIYFPLIIITLQSVNDSSTGRSFMGFTLKWYQAMLYNEELMRAIGITISMAVIATLISVVFGTLASIGIHSLAPKKRKRAILLNNVPVLNADIVTGVFLMLMLQGISFIIPGVKVFGYFSMLFAHVFFCTPYVVLSILPKLNEIDNNLFDAALDLGCTPNGALRKVIIPSIKAGIISGGLIAFTMSIDDFVISYMTSGNGVLNFSMWLYSIRNPFRNNTMQMASAYNTIISMGTLVILIIYNLLKMRKKKGVNH